MQGEFSIEQLLIPANGGVRRPSRGRWLWVTAGGLLLLAAMTVGWGRATSFKIDPKVLQRMESLYGLSARQRLLDWQRLMIRASGDDERTKLTVVNRFFNRLAFISDQAHWGKKDYWATPLEFLASDGGDCEDFAVAKYFTLKQLGVPEERMSLTYVKALRLNQAHMVLTYTPSPGAEPLVLDNLEETIRPASERTDLLPVYSFNGDGLWLAKQRGRGKRVGRSSRLSRWRDLLARMQHDVPM